MSGVVQCLSFVTGLLSHNVRARAGPRQRRPGVCLHCGLGLFFPAYPSGCTLCVLRGSCRPGSHLCGWGSFLFHQGCHDFPLAVESLCIPWCLMPDWEAKCIGSLRLASSVSHSLKAHCLRQPWAAGIGKLLSVFVTCRRGPG